LVTDIAYAYSTSPSCTKQGDALAWDGEVAETTESYEIKAYPNPVTDKLYVDLDGNMVTDQDIMLFDSHGKKVMLGGIEPTSETLEIDMRNMISGLYIIRINLGDKVETFRIIKL
jgi:hypothetical protein